MDCSDNWSGVRAIKLKKCFLEFLAKISNRPRRMISINKPENSSQVIINDHIGKQWGSIFFSGTRL